MKLSNFFENISIKTMVIEDGQVKFVEKPNALKGEINFYNFTEKTMLEIKGICKTDEELEITYHAIAKATDLDMDMTYEEFKTKINNQEGNIYFISLMEQIIDMVLNTIDKLQSTNELIEKANLKAKLSK